MGLETRVVNDSNSWDALVIGGGPAAFSACIYLSRAGFKTAYIEKNVPGGRLVNIALIENYAGFSSISGADLALKMYQQAEGLGIQPIFGEVDSIDRYEDYHVVHTTDGVTRYCKVLIIATGTISNKLPAIDAEKYENKGVSYCAKCDGALAKGKEVYVVGGGDSAVTNAIYLSKICKKVTLVHLRGDFRAQKEYVEQLKKLPNCEIITCDEITKVYGDGEKVTDIDVTCKQENVTTKYKCDYIFVYIGSKPSTNFIKDPKLLGEAGYVKHDCYMATEVPGLYAVGDVSGSDYQQISVAVGQGTMAALNAIKYLNSKHSH
ncbi:MAG: FAD-dependent oxidoreductase [Mycoplasma sp.]